MVDIDVDTHHQAWFLNLTTRSSMSYHHGSHGVSKDAKVVSGQGWGNRVEMSTSWRCPVATLPLIHQPIHILPHGQRLHDTVTSLICQNHMVYWLLIEFLIVYASRLLPKQQTDVPFLVSWGLLVNCLKVSVVSGSRLEMLFMTSLTKQINSFQPQPNLIINNFPVWITCPTLPVI